MTDKSAPSEQVGTVQEKSVDAMVAMNAAIRNIHLYPISSAACKNAIEKAFSFLSGALEADRRLSFAESEKRLIVSGRPLSESDLQKPQVNAFLDLLLNFEIKEIVIRKEIDADEFGRFLAVIAKPPGEIEKSGGLKQALEAAGLLHIDVDQKIYISVDKGGEVPPSGGGGASLSADFGPMVGMLDALLDVENKQKVSRCLADSVVRKDESFLTDILIQPHKGEMGEHFFRDLIGKLDDDMFVRLMRNIRLQLLREQEKEGAEASAERADALRTALMNMLRTPMGKAFRERAKSRKTPASAPPLIQKPSDVRTSLGMLIRKNYEALKDETFMAFLPTAVEQLFRRRQNNAADTIVNRLRDALLNKAPEIRLPASVALSEICNRSPADIRMHILSRLSDELSEWVKSKKETGPAYENICEHLKDLAEQLILDQKYEKCVPIVESLHIACFSAPHECPLPDRNFIEEIASEETLERLMADFKSDSPDVRKAATDLLVRLGGFSPEPLLQLLRESSNRLERARILKSITEIGPKALPYLTAHIQAGRPWYYMRNLILLFGKMGDESHADLLIPFLEDDDYRVRRETLNSIFQIGGRKREEVFSYILPIAQDKFKLDVVRMLGRIRSRKTVPKLLEMLESKAVVSSKFRTDMQEQICRALGQIGSEAAVPVLQEMAQTSKRSLLSIGDDAARVKSAAFKALNMIWEAEKSGRAARKTN